MNMPTMIAEVQNTIGVPIDGNAGPVTWSALYQFFFQQAPPGTGLDKITRDIQAKVGVAVDGNAGIHTWTAIYNSVCNQTAVSDVGASFVLDSRRETNVSTLLPEVQPYARLLVQKAGESGVTIKIINGFRTYAEQDALYAQGRTAPGPKCTNARWLFKP